MRHAFRHDPGIEVAGPDVSIRWPSVRSDQVPESLKEACLLTVWTVRFEQVLDDLRQPELVRAQIVERIEAPGVQTVLFTFLDPCALPPLAQHHEETPVTLRVGLSGRGQAFRKLRKPFRVGAVHAVSVRLIPSGANHHTGTIRDAPQEPAHFCVGISHDRF